MQTLCFEGEFEVHTLLLFFPKTFNFAVHNIGYWILTILSLLVSLRMSPFSLFTQISVIHHLRLSACEFQDEKAAYQGFYFLSILNLSVSYHSSAVMNDTMVNGDQRRT